MVTARAGTACHSGRWARHFTFSNRLEFSICCGQHIAGMSSECRSSIGLVSYILMNEPKYLWNWSWLVRTGYPQGFECCRVVLSLKLLSEKKNGTFLESTFIDQNNPKRQTADPQWGSPKLDLSGLVYGGLPGMGPWPDSRF
jgi:hypothetical protein